ncbi:class I SAM-dependent methyltransferase [soil metagenome]
MSASLRPVLDLAKRHAFVQRFVEDLGTAVHLATVILGDRLGLYQAMAGGEPMTPADLAERTGTSERYVAEWLAGQAAACYVDYDPADATFRLPPEHAAALTGRGAAVFIPGAFQVAASVVKDEPILTEAFRTGRGVARHEHHPDLFVGWERSSRADYEAHLVSHWLPALDGVEDRLRAGATVADVGSGHGASTVVMAEAYPASTFVGFDDRAESVEMARAAVVTAGLGERARFAQASAEDFPGSGYDLVACFDFLHLLGDPVGVAAHVRSSLAAGGTWLIVEPCAHDRLEDNLSAMGKVFYNLSAMISIPAASTVETVGLALGAQAGEERLRAVVTEAGFSRFRRVTETPGHHVFAAQL